MDTGLISRLKSAFIETRSGPPALQLLFIFIFLVGMHSVILGTFIFFFTDTFYRLFFMTHAENIFFVRQSGLFLFCLGSFYFIPLLELRQNRLMIGFIIATKVLAVLFLLCYAHLSAKPPIILLAAAGDGFMGALLALLLYKAGSVIQNFR